MISLADVQQWKKEHGNIYQFTIFDPDEDCIFYQDFIFKELGRKEYEEIILQDLDDGEMQEVICQAAVLYPADYDFSNGLGGVAEILHEAIVDVSGWGEGQAEMLLNEYRSQMNMLDHQIDCIIHEAFPEISFEEMQGWSPQKTMYYLSRAEWILRTLRGKNLIPIGSEQAPQQMAPMPQPRPAPQNLAAYQQIQQDTPKQAPTKPGELSEEEVKAMLAQSMAQHPNGGKFIDTSRDTSLEESFPEISWFRHEDELRGEFD
jgi:hypothetical protein